jgi:hypothetical protein
MSFRKSLMIFLTLLCLSSLTPGYCAPGDWRATVATDMPRLGHRNWIAIVDSAYPLQSRNGIETIVADASETTVLKTVLAQINASRHVRPIIYTDAELKYVPDSDAPGVSAYRAALANILGKRPVNTMLHEQIIAKLDQSGQTFNILIIKTNMAIPYTSVFIQLNCKYWSDDAEKRLRAKMAAAGVQPAN